MGVYFPNWTADYISDYITLLSSMGDFFSYDIRNIAPVIPFFAMAVGEGLQVFLAYFTRLIKQIASVHPETPVKMEVLPDGELPFGKACLYLRFFR